MKTDNKLLFENKGKFLLVHSSSGYKHALKEVLQDPAVLARLVDTKETYQLQLLLIFLNDITPTREISAGANRHQDLCTATVKKCLYNIDGMYGL